MKIINKFDILFYYYSETKTSGVLQESGNPKINHKESRIENLLEFLGLQSFDGKFLPNESFYKFFYKNDSNDFINLKQEIENEMGSEIINNNNRNNEIEEILSICISISYLEIIMFKNFKDECEMCYEKAEKSLKKIVENDEKRNLFVEEAKEWIKNWVNDSNE